MPRAKPYPTANEDEQTNIASGWEDEASTTVEQGEVADKLRAPGLPQKHNTNFTHTGTGVDEPTVDDQHAPVLSAITPIRPDHNGRLIITQGNDQGQEIEIRPGKTYTIGRGIDNDFVLTDISVSRKHFDLKHEDGAWVIVDRGSGNGTVVNGNLEDNPFMLASGDTIEIGNTVFRFEQANGAPRPSKAAFDPEEEEMSTVAGKPVRTDPIELVEPVQARPPRPKTLPPPTPLRPANQSAPPPLRPNNPSAPPPSLNVSFASMAPPLPASTLPMPQMANRPPLVGPGSPTMLGDAMGMPQHHGHNLPLGPNGLPTTIPGQGMPQQRPSYPYPTTNEIPPHSVHAQMLLIQTQNRRGDGSTAHVPPMTYDPMMPMGGLAPPQQQRYGGTPEISKRTKLLLAGIGLAILTGIVTAAVVKSSSNPKPAASAPAKPGDKKKTSSSDAKVAMPSKPTVEPIVKEPEVPKQSLVKDPPKQEAPKVPVVKDPPKQEPPKQEPPKQEVANQDPPKQEPPKQEPPKQEPPKQEPPKQEKKVVKQEPKKTERRRESRRETTRQREPEPKRVAVAAPSGDSSAALDKADSQYRSKKFNDAASTLAAAAKSVSDSEASKLRLKSESYAKLGKAYSVGMAPAQKSTLAYEALVSALNYDGNLGGAFESELKTKLTATAPKAAMSYLGAKEWKKARTAAVKAANLGSTDGNLSVVKQKLEQVAGDLYNEASKEIGTNPGPAKEKLRLVKEIVDGKSSWAVKAEMLLRKS